MLATQPQRTRKIELICPSISDVVTYSNPHVIDSFRSLLDVSEGEAHGIFHETIKWLWFCNDVAARPFDGMHNAPVIDSSLLIIDEMWHTFILHTRDYFDFCFKHFGRYLHHQPTLRAEKEAMQASLQVLTTEQRASLLTEQKRGQYNAVYERLGRDTFKTWYFTYPDQYPLERILRLRRK